MTLCSYHVRFWSKVLALKESVLQHKRNVTHFYSQITNHICSLALFLYLHKTFQDYMVLLYWHIFLLQNHVFFWSQVNF